MRTKSKLPIYWWTGYVRDRTGPSLARLPRGAGGSPREVRSKCPIIGQICMGIIAGYMGIYCHICIRFDIPPGCLLSVDAVTCYGWFFTPYQVFTHNILRLITAQQVNRQSKTIYKSICQQPEPVEAVSREETLPPRENNKQTFTVGKWLRKCNMK